MKMYSNEGRKPMMAGGDTRKKMMYGGDTRKKRESGTPSGTMGERANKMTAERRETLMRQIGQMERALEEKKLSPEVLQQMREELEMKRAQLEGSPTPGRMNVDR